MRPILFVLLAILSAPAFAAPFRAPTFPIDPNVFKLPDLFFPSVRILSQYPKGDGSEVFELSVTVKNAGTGAATAFKLAAEARGLSGSPQTFFAVPLHSTAGAFSWYTFSSALAAGESRTLNLSVVLSGDFNLRPHPLIVIEADSCSGDELMPNYCRVYETDEHNNTRLAR